MKLQNPSPKVLQIANVVTFVAVVAFNFLATALPLNNRSTGEISDELPSYFTPAGYTFSIWSVIYLALLGFAIYQALPNQRERPFLQRIGWLFVANGIFNISWLFAWHYGAYPLSVLLMVAILGTLIAIYSRLDIGRRSVELKDKLFYHVPFSLYLGWITVATIANIASVMNYYGWNGFGIAEPIWSAIMMSVAVVVVGILLFNRQDFAYAAVLIWALFGIRNAYPDVAVVANTAVIAAVAILILALVGFWRTRQDETQPITRLV